MMSSLDEDGFDDEEEGKKVKKKKKKKKKKQKKRRPLRIKRVTTCHHDTAVGHAVVFECTKV